MTTTFDPKDIARGAAIARRLMGKPPIAGDTELLADAGFKGDQRWTRH